ncbi:MAG: hypothetical protein K2K66_05000 [Ruminococcus sp.]|nr:hypothetical protein [Ruminococcus sp.]
MIDSIINKIIENLSRNGIKNIYSAYDAISVEKKGRDFYTLVGLESFEMHKPIYSALTLFMPYEAEISLNITAPENYSIQKLYEYFSEKIKPAVMNFSGIDCYIKKISMKHNLQINRLVLTVRLSVSGIEKSERENT